MTNAGPSNNGRSKKGPRRPPDTMKLFYIQNANMRSKKQPVWYLPPGDPLIALLKNKHSVTSGTVPQPAQLGSGTPQVHRNLGFRGSRPDWYRMIQFFDTYDSALQTAMGTRGKVGKNVTYVVPTRLFTKRGLGEFENVTPFDIVPSGSAFVMPANRIWHQTPAGNRKRATLLTGLEIPPEVLFEMGHYTPSRAPSFLNVVMGGSSSPEKPQINHLRRQVSSMPPPHMFNTKGLIEQYTEKSKSRSVKRQRRI